MGGCVAAIHELPLPINTFFRRSNIMAHDVVISYSSKDKAIADAVCARLENRGIRCWIASRDVQPGEEWGRAIIVAVENCRVVVVIFSSNSNESGQVLREVERAVHNNKIIIPFRIEDVIPSKSMQLFLSVHHWLDAITPPLESHIEKLATIINTLIERIKGVNSEKPQTPEKPKIKTDVPLYGTSVKKHYRFKYLYYITSGILLSIFIFIVIKKLGENPTKKNLTEKSIITQIDTSPEQFIRNYYQLVNDCEYDKAWTMLSKKFKNNKNYDLDYKQWWGKNVTQVMIVALEITEKSTTTIKAKTDLRYFMKNGKIVDERNLYIQLVRGSTEDDWLIDSVWFDNK